MQDISIQNVAVIGAGRAGRSFALSCIAAGFQVTLEDVMPSRLRQAEADYADLAPGTGKLILALTVEEAVRSADIVVDFVPDELESKLEIVSLVDRMAPPKTILCTPIEGISITDLASCTYRDDRCLGVRGLQNGAVRLLYPASVKPDVLHVATGFFEQLGLVVTAEADPDLPMLMKNVVYTR